MDFAEFPFIGSEEAKNDPAWRILPYRDVVEAPRRCHGTLRQLSKGGCMYQYKDHPIYGIGIRGPEKKWYGRGLIFDAEDKVTEIKRLESAELTFATKKKAEEHAVKLCKEWIDEQSSGIDSSGLTHSAPLKAGALSL